MKLGLPSKPLLAFIACVAVAPMFPIPDFWIAQANYVGLFAIVALGLVVLTGVAGLTSFGQAAFVGMGAYATAFLTTRYGMNPWITLFAGLAITGVSAYVIGVVTLRMSGHYLPLATIAWSIAIYYLFGGIQWLGKYDGIANLPTIHLLGFDLAGSRGMYFLVWGVLLLAIWALYNLLDSRPGRAIRALKGGTRLAESLGADTARYKIIVFVMAAQLASISGWLYAHLQRAVNPSPFGLNASLEYMIMVVVGGMAHLWGALLGSSIVKITQDQLQVLLPRMFGTAGNYESIVFGLVLILLLRFAPEGLWPFLRRIAKRSPFSDAAGGTPSPQPLTRRKLPDAATPVLDVEGMRKTFGGLVAVNDVSFKAKAGEIVALIGPNGAGKSTTFNLVTGMLTPTAGEVRFLGARIDNMRPRDIAKLGIARTFQHVKLLPGMSVLENVALGAHLRSGVGCLSAMLRLDRAEEARLLNEAAGCLQRVGLGDYLHRDAATLALGQQRILEIARALTADPILLLLDEPAAGLRHQEKQALATLLAQLRADGLTILLVEHDMDFVMQLTDHIVVLVFGTKIAEGKPEAIREHPAVLEAYLGSDA
jgi:branched-chain amino acid transport system permease protein